MTPAGFVIIGRRFTFYPSFRNPGIYRVFRLFCTSFSHFDVKDYHKGLGEEETHSRTENPT